MMVELNNPVGDHQRVVIGQRDDAGAEADELGALGGDRDEQLGELIVSNPAEWCSPIQAS
jgi:hypothetical protein